MPAALRRVNVHPVLIGPHEGKLDLLPIWSLEEALVQCAVEERATTGTLKVRLDVRRNGRRIPVPIKQKEIDAVGCCGINLMCHDLWIVFGLIEPKARRRERQIWLQVAWITWCGLNRQLPLGPVCAVQLFVLDINVPVAKVNGADIRSGSEG